MMRPLIAIVLLFPWSCQPEQENFSNFLESECKGMHLGEKETNIIQAEAFDVIVPGNWEVKTSTEDGLSTFAFIESADTTDNLEISDEEFSMRHVNFLALTLTYGEVYKSMNYNEEFEKAVQEVKYSNQTTILSRGTSSFDRNPIDWIIYKDETFKKDSLKCETISTCIYNSKYYLWILGQVFGEVDKELRQCELKKIMETIDLKV